MSIPFTATQGVVWSSPTVDVTNSWAYVAFDNRLHKVSYPVSESGSVVSATSRYFAATSSSAPPSR